MHLDMDFDRLSQTCELFSKFAKKKSKKKPWADKPKGWDNKSVKHYSKTMMKGKKHPFTECVKKMKDKDISDPEAFCASIKQIYKKK